MCVVVSIKWQFNPNKHYAVTPQTRKDILEQLIHDTGYKNIKVEIVSGYAWRWCAANQVQWLARGIRTFAKETIDDIPDFTSPDWLPL